MFVSSIRLRFLCLPLLMCGILSINIAQNTVDSLSVAKGESYFNKINSQLSFEEIVEYSILALPYFKNEKYLSRYMQCISWALYGFYNLENFEDYYKYASKLVAITKNAHGEKSIFYGNALGNLAIYYDVKGNYSESLKINQQSLSIAKENNSLLEIVACYSNIGYTYRAMGDYEASIEYFKKAYLIRVKIHGINDRDLPGDLTSIAKVFKERQELDSAFAYYHKAINLVKLAPPSKYLTQAALYSYQDLADIYLEQGKSDSSIFYINQALNASKEYNLLEDYQTHIIYGNFLLKEGSHKAALQQFQKAHTSVEKEYSAYQKHPEIARVLAWQAKVFQKQKDFANAISIYQKALSINTIDFNDTDFTINPEVNQFINNAIAIDLLGDKSNILFQDFLLGSKQKKSLEAAFTSYQLLNDLIKNVRQSYFAQGSKTLLSGKVISHFETAIKVALALYDLTNENQYIEEAWRFAESNKALILLESITEQSAKKLSGIPDSLLQQDKDFSNDLAFYQTKLFEEQQKNEIGDAEKIKRWEEKVFDTKQEKRKLSEYLLENFPKYDQLKGNFEVASIDHLRKELLTTNNLLIEFFVGEKELFVFCISKDSISVKRASLNTAFRESILSFRKTISNPPTSENFEKSLQIFQKQASNLYDLLLRNSLENTPKAIHQIILIPDDILNYIPFEILISQQTTENISSYSLTNLDYLFEDYSFSYGYSGTLLLKTIEREKINDLKLFLGFAPTFGNEEKTASRDCIAEMVHDLYCNQPEVNALQQLLKGDVFLEQEASVENFKNTADKYNILHLSTHACINDENPMLNKIFLADGDLSNYDLMNLSLNAEMVVLSACNTGTGKLLKGEGIMSLARGFTLGGCPSTVTSLWSVDDCSTSQLMTYFYENLLQGATKDKALQLAKMDFLRATDISKSHPYYWAAFTQFGDTRQLFSQSKKYLFFVLGFITLVIFGMIKYRVK